MNTSPPPPVVVVQQKRGLGCFGIGCVVLVLALLLIGGLIAVGGYLAYSKMGSLTSAAPIATQTFDGGDDVFRGAEQKISTFQQAEQLHKPGILELSADEINTLIARNTDLSRMGVHAFVTMTGDSMEVEMSISTNVIPYGLIKDRFFNGVAQASPSFDPASKNLTIVLHKLKLGDQDISDSQLVTFQSQFNTGLNSKLQASPDAQSFLERAKRIEIRDGKLEIETE